jgi:hypothetical protein
VSPCHPTQLSPVSLAENVLNTTGDTAVLIISDSAERVGLHQKYEIQDMAWELGISHISYKIELGAGVPLIPFHI